MFCKPFDKAGSIFFWLVINYLSKMSVTQLFFPLPRKRKIYLSASPDLFLLAVLSGSHSIRLAKSSNCTVKIKHSTAELYFLCKPWPSWSHWKNKWKNWIRFLTAVEHHLLKGEIRTDLHYLFAIFIGTPWKIKGLNQRFASQSSYPYLNP